MSIEALLHRARQAVPAHLWGEAVQLARRGAVRGVSDDGDEIHLQVRVKNDAVPLDVWIWPDDDDFECDTSMRTVEGWSVPVVASLIALRQARVNGTEEELPEPEERYQVKLRYALTSKGPDLFLERLLVWPDGTVKPLKGALARTDAVIGRGDAQAETLLSMHGGGRLGGETTRRLLRFLEGKADATLDGKPVHLSPQDIPFVVRVRDEADDFRVGLFRPSDIDKLYRGAAQVGATLHPTSHGDLSPEQRKQLTRGITYRSDQMHLLVNEALPRLRLQIPVIVETDRLPEGDQLEPRVAVAMEEVPLGLKVEAYVVYGDPPVAQVREGVLQALGDVVPARDMGRERMVIRQFQSKTGLTVGVKRVLHPEQAAAFLMDDLPRHDGPVIGQVAEERFDIVNAPVIPRLDVVRQDDDKGRPNWALDISFEGEEGEADPWAVLEAWKAGRGLVPLFQGGFAPLPKDWLQEHGTVLRELMEARDASGRVDRNATAALVELLEGNEHAVPQDLTRLRDFLTSGEDLPAVPIPDGFQGELRLYQVAGFRWLNFLRQMDLHGILADDMGLGKTIQALCAMLHAGGKSLVVCPTSVLRNWKREAEKFTPELTVNVYHGPDRQLDDSDITLTSYALMRLDLDKLYDRGWMYVVLDEAQAIKNPSSQTARAACRMQAEHRLCLTGTPVENRLEELWSLFRFLMPGLLGSVESFRERFVRPIESGNGQARADLHRRVRPYVLRRLKQQVAPELPTLTEMVIRCEMSKAQRRVYDAVRMAARADVQRAITERGLSRSTFQVLEALLRMRQACCDPSLLPGEAGQGAPSCKLDRLEELLVDVLTEGHKALIFSQWTGLLDRVEPRLEHLGIDFVRLDGSTRNRQDIIDTFQSDDGPPVFLLSLKAGGTGLNLTAADYVVHLDPWWNPAVEQQATDRAHRIGQDKPVVSCRFIAEESVEERILELQDAKRDLAEAALGADGGFVKSLSADELRTLFDDVA